MKHAIIGDLHGRDNWRDIYSRAFDKIVFLGDYVNSDTFSDAAILENPERIINLKKKYPEKIVLLLGNHDVQYLHFPRYRCTGFSPSMQPELTNLFNTNRYLFQIKVRNSSNRKCYNSLRL